MLALSGAPQIRRTPPVQTRTGWRSNQLSSRTSLRLNTGERWQREEFPHSSVDHLAILGDQGASNDFVFQIELELAVFDHVANEIRDVSRVHLAGVIRHRA